MDDKYIVERLKTAVRTMRSKEYPQSVMETVYGAAAFNKFDPTITEEIVQKAINAESPKALVNALQPYLNDALKKRGVRTATSEKR